MNSFVVVLMLAVGGSLIFKGLGKLGDPNDDFELDMSFFDDYIREGDTKYLDTDKTYYNKEDVKKLSDLEVVTRTIYGEARGSDPVEWEWIAQTIKNRKESSHYPDTYKSVCLQPIQFTPWNSSTPMTENQKAVRKVDIVNTQKYRKIESVVKNVLNRNYTPPAQRNVYNFLTDRADKPKIRTAKGRIINSYATWAEGMVVAYKGDHYFIRRG